MDPNNTTAPAAPAEIENEPPAPSAPTDPAPEQQPSIAAAPTSGEAEKPNGEVITTTLGLKYGHVEKRPGLVTMNFGAVIKRADKDRKPVKMLERGPVKKGLKDTVKHAAPKA